MALLHVNFYSDTLGMRTELDVVLPEKQIDGKFQVLFLLHGMSDDQTVWQRLTSIERYAMDRDLAVVMPTTYLGWYTNNACGERYFDFITKELPEIVLGMFPTISDKREDTFVAGLSMGGYGALKCGLCAPHLFSHAASLSGALDMAGMLEFMAAGGLERHSEDGSVFPDAFGDLACVRGSDNDLLAVAARLAPEDRPRVFIWCGTADFLYEANVTMRDRLIELDYDLSYSEGPGDHAWFYWDREIQHVMDWLPLKKWGDA